MADKKIIAVTGATGAQAGGPATEAGGRHIKKGRQEQKVQTVEVISTATD